MRFNKLAMRAKRIYDKRGGSAAAKGDMQELKEVRASGGSTTSKLKRAAKALKDPGAPGPRR